MIIKENLEIVNVDLETTKATFTFLDAEGGVIHDVNWNKQDFDRTSSKWVDSPEKAEKVNGWARDIFGCEYSDLGSVVGQKKTVYVYDKFCSLWESSTVSKFKPEQKGEIYQTEIKDVIVDNIFIKIQYEIDGELHESKQTMGKYLENMKKWFPDPQKADKEKAKFEEKYGIPVERASELIGLPIMVEVKLAFGNTPYGEIKKPNKRK